MRALSTIPAAALLALAGCDSLFAAELQVTEIRLILPAQEFPASDTTDARYFCDPAAPQSFPPCVSLSLDYEVGASLPVVVDPNVTYDLRLSDLALRLAATQTVTGDKDLSGVKQVTVRVREDPLIRGSGAVLATYVRPPRTGPVGSFAVSGNANLDLAPYVQSGRLPLHFELVVDGVGPTPAFTADLEAGFSLQVKIDWGSYL